MSQISLGFGNKFVALKKGLGTYRKLQYNKNSMDAIE